jgi:[ribosomal protein S18]-alanine N-acetyltransferase
LLQITRVDSQEELERHIAKDSFVAFMHHALDRFADPEKQIAAAVDYAFSKDAGRGGFVLLGHLEGELVGAVVMNDTGMGGYIPQYVLVYIAVRPESRGQGLGGKLMDRSVEETGGDFKLHVERDNPAVRLYKRVGLTDKYKEMRFEGPKNGA